MSTRADDIEEVIKYLGTLSEDLRSIADLGGTDQARTVIKEIVVSLEPELSVAETAAVLGALRTIFKDATGEDLS